MSKILQFRIKLLVLALANPFNLLVWFIKSDYFIKNKENPAVKLSLFFLSIINVWQMSMQTKAVMIKPKYPFFHSNYRSAIVEHLLDLMRPSYDFLLLLVLGELSSSDPPSSESNSMLLIRLNLPSLVTDLFISNLLPPYI